MTTKQTLFTMIAFIFTTNCMGEDFVFDRGMFTRINGNDAFAYIHLKRMQLNPSYVFEYTRVVECSKDKKFTEIGTLGSLENAYRSTILGRSGKVDRFEEFARMNNAIYCGDIEQKLNYYDELENVGAIIYGARNVEDCALFREYLAQQKAAAEKK